MNRQQITIPLILLGFFLFCFVFLLTLSTSQDKLAENYTFEEKATLTLPYDYNSQEYIGTAQFSNKGILPVKHKIKQFVLCDFDAPVPQTYQIIYVGRNLLSGNDFLFENYHEKSVELGAGDTLALYMKLEYFRPKREKEKEVDLRTLQIFELEDLSYNYDYCIDKNITDAIGTINLTLENDEIY